MNTPSLTIEAVEQQFRQWRATKQHHRVKIPDFLWDKIKALLEKYKVGQITRRLQISTKQLRAQGLLSVNTLATLAVAPLQAPSFVKVELAPTPPIIAPPLATSTLTIERSNGVRLCLTSPSLEQLQIFIKAFTE